MRARRGAAWGCGEHAAWAGTCVSARTQKPIGILTALIPAPAISSKSASTIHDDRWLVMAFRTLSVSPWLAAFCALTHREAVSRP